MRWLVGTWEFEREVRGNATMRGTVTIVRNGETSASYQERCRVQLADGHTLQASRSYALVELHDGFAVRLSESGELFEQLHFQEIGNVLVAAAAYTCVADQYRSEWRLGPENSFLVLREVSGPRKQYISESVFRRVENLRSAASGACDPNEL